MIILITGASHTGKTALAQRLMEKRGWPYLSLDHLKMGLIRSGYTSLTVEEDDALTAFMWPIVREMIKTAIENDQHMIIEGCYLPFDWQKDFDRDYLPSIRFICLVMTEDYIRGHFGDIRAYGSVVENRGDDPGLDLEALVQDNAAMMAQCRSNGFEPLVISGEYCVPLPEC
ncbi:MAG: adenylate kinase [Clostridia bacterium]|nr:adenylate kinase [Clostridia bacterium]